MTEYEYIPLDFSKINSVKLVDETDKDFLQWQKKIYSKNRKTKSQLRREKEQKQYPEEWEELKQTYLNRSCFYCSKLHGTWCYEHQCRITKDFNQDAKKCEYYQMKISIWNRNWCKHLNLHRSNINYYLYDLGLIEKPKNQNFNKGKEKEIRFKDKLKNISEIEIIDKFFKIYYDNYISFKFPDVIFEKNKKYSIIEYKSASYYGEFLQIYDYKKLFNMAGIEELDNLYWIIYRCDPVWLDEIKVKASNNYGDDIQIYLEDDFLNLFNGKGLDAWM